MEESNELFINPKGIYKRTAEMKSKNLFLE